MVYNILEEVRDTTNLFYDLHWNMVEKILHIFRLILKIQSIFKLLLSRRMVLIFFNVNPLQRNLFKKQLSKIPKCIIILSPKLQNDKALFLRLVQNGIVVNSKFSTQYRDLQNFIQIIYDVLTSKKKPFENDLLQ